MRFFIGITCALLSSVAMAQPVTHTDTQTQQKLCEGYAAVGLNVFGLRQSGVEKQELLQQLNETVDSRNYSEASKVQAKKDFSKIVDFAYSIEYLGPTSVEKVGPAFAEDVFNWCLQR